VITDRQTVPVGLGDVVVCLAGVAEVRAHVVMVHPLHNFSVVKFDPEEAVGCGAPLSEARLTVEEEEETSPQPGDVLTFYGLNLPYEPVVQQCVITGTELKLLPDGKPPVFTAAPFEALMVDHVSPCVGGLFRSLSGSIVALWSCFGFRKVRKARGTDNLGVPKGRDA
jgi:pro-apoptotic serine protease NMA111